MNRNKILTLTAISFLLVLSIGLSSSGNGTTDNPYIVTNCTNIKEAGFYELNNTLNGTQPEKDYCIGITSNDTTINGKEFFINGSSSTNDSAICQLLSSTLENVTVKNTQIELTNTVKQGIEQRKGMSLASDQSKIDLTPEEWREVINTSTELKKQFNMSRKVEFPDSTVSKTTLNIEFNQSKENLYIVDNVTKKFAETSSNINITINPQPTETTWIKTDPVLLMHYESVEESNISIEYETSNFTDSVEASDFQEPQVYTLDSLNLTCQRKGCPEGEVCREIEQQYQCVENQEPEPKFTVLKSNWTAEAQVKFNAAQSSDPDGTIETYEWKFGDGTTLGGDMVKHTYLEPGNYTVALKVIDNNGATSTQTRTIEVTGKEVRKVGAVTGNLIAVLVVIGLVVALGWMYKSKSEDKTPLEG